MLPPGHIAAGFLTAYTLLKVTNPAFSEEQITQLYLIGMFTAFAPDLDFFYAFFRVRSFTIQNNSINHRLFFTHAPVVWLVAGLLVYFLSPTEFLQFTGLLIWLGAWSHFALDSIQHGVMWLWPLSKKRFALRRAGMAHKGITEPNFFKFWLKFLTTYPKELPYTFISEVFIIIIFLLVFFSTNYSLLPTN